MKTEQHKDPRSAQERAADLTDQRLFDFYHENGLVEARDDRQYSREDVLNIARNAYWVGVADKARDPEGTAQVATEVRRVLGAV